jgi:beta-N-acetylhexosaminidase
MTRAFIAGVSGPTLTAEERAFLREAAPWGLILFTRNIDNPDQVRALTRDFRDAVGRADAPVLIDQEGGRVQRLGPPQWPAYPPGAAYGRLYDHNAAAGLAAARLGARLIAADLVALGIDVDCLPLADVPVPGADSVIGDRAYGETPDKVAAIANAVTEGLMQGGVLPVLKHIPGHGRATADSHHRLPVVATERAILEKTDFQAFRPLARLPLAMTAHVVFSAIDGEPATTSATIIGQVIRDSIGFAGALMSDDISMGALSGTISERTRRAFTAGCDLVLHCNGCLDEMRAVATESPHLSGEGGRRAAAALAARRPADDIDLMAARATFAEMTGKRPPLGTAKSHVATS